MDFSMESITTILKTLNGVLSAVMTLDSMAKKKILKCFLFKTR